MENDNKYIERQWTFNDGVRTIDYVLVWDEYSRRNSLTENVEKRRTFETNLMEEGLKLEHEFIEDSGFHFTKIHAPLKILQRYAEILKLRMPLKDIINTKKAHLSGKLWKSNRKCCLPVFKCFEIPNIFPDCSHELTSTYTRAHDYLFDVKSPGFFTPALKARIIQFIMDRTLYTNEGITDTFEFGIHRLVLHKVYAAAYPLHDGDLNTPGSMRYMFYNYWASFKNWYKKQPADNIRQYFGVKIALYFVWLGYYTQMLIPASIVGVACFIASLFLSPGDDATDDVCDGKIEGVLCPSCDYHCNFVSVADTCINSKILYIFDNPTTVFFAIFMSFWAAIFLESWKRYSTEITFRWDLSWLDDKDENPRPEYAAKLSKLAANREVSRKLNFITNAMEPSVTFWRHIFPGKVLSVTTVLLLVTLAVAAVIGVVIVHMIALVDRVIPSLSAMSSIVAICLNLVCILTFSPIYAKVAAVLTELELPRTQQQFDKSLYIKMYLLEFINQYSSIFYIAFFKGKFIGPPLGYYRVFGFRQLECGAGGCMLELTKQLAVIMIGKRAFKFLVQFFQPKLEHLWRKRSMTIDGDLSQWEKDFVLSEKGPGMLLPEYLDMVLQYGFVTIFVSAFPLAPLFALINNIFEIRVDAQKVVVYQRRVAMRRVKDIGVWFCILDYISKMAVFTNAFIIAFTSNFIPRLMYRVRVSPNLSLAGYINNTLSYISIQDLDMKGKPNTTEEYCRYIDYREPPWSENKYEVTPMFWELLAFRLGFFIIFENIIITAVVLLRWCIPEVSRQVQWQMRRRHHLVSEAIISQECSQKRTKTVLKKIMKDEDFQGVEV